MFEAIPRSKPAQKPNTKAKTKLEGRGRCQTTHGDLCLFPFIYKGRKYKGCTKYDHTIEGVPTYWCATEVNYNRVWTPGVVEGSTWGNCDTWDCRDDLVDSKL